MLPATIAVLNLFRGVAFDCERTATVWVRRCTVLRQNYFALPRSDRVGSKHAIFSAVDSWFHGASKDLRNKHPLIQFSNLIGFDPSFRLDRFTVTKVPGGGLE